MRTIPVHHPPKIHGLHTSTTTTTTTTATIIMVTGAKHAAGTCCTCPQVHGAFVSEEIKWAVQFVHQHGSLQYGKSILALGGRMGTEMARWVRTCTMRCMIKWWPLLKEEGIRKVSLQASNCVLLLNQFNICKRDFKTDVGSLIPLTLQA